MEAKDRHGELREQLLRLTRRKLRGLPIEGLTEEGLVQQLLLEAERHDTGWPSQGSYFHYLRQALRFRLMEAVGESRRAALPQPPDALDETFADAISALQQLMTAVQGRMAAARASRIDFYPVFLLHLRLSLLHWLQGSLLAGCCWHELRLAVERYLPWTPTQRLLTITAAWPTIEEIWQALLREKPELTVSELCTTVNVLLGHEGYLSTAMWYQWVKRASALAMVSCNEAPARDLLRALLGVGEVGA